jgi:hypothetical protein
MSNGSSKKEINSNISNLNGSIKKVNIQIQINDYDAKNERELKLPYLAPRKKSDHIMNQNRKTLRRKLVQIGNFCQSIYTNSNPSLNNTKTMEDILNDTKLKAIEDIKNDFFVNQHQSNNKEDNNIKDNMNNNKQFYKKIILNKSKPKSLKKIINKNIINNNNKEKFTFLTTTSERDEKKERNYSIDNARRNKIRFNYGDYASNRIIVNHPKLYVLNNKKENSIDKLPLIKQRMNQIHIVEEISKILPDKLYISREEKRSQYDEYMKAKELKNPDKF